MRVLGSFRGPVAKAASAVLLTVSALTAPTAASALEVFSDNFDSYAEDYGITSVGPWRTASSPSPYPDAIGGGGVDVVGAGTSYDWYPGNGRYIDLDGSFSNRGPSFFYTDVAVGAAAAPHPGYAGQWTASLSFDLAQNQGGSPGVQLTPYIKDVAVGDRFSSFVLTSYTNTLTFSGPIGAADVWRIGFWTPSNTQFGPVLDNVVFSITPVPEPATIGLMLAGLAAVGFTARRKKTG